MARKSTPAADQADDAPLLALVDQDAPEGSTLVVVDNEAPPPPAVVAQRAASIVLLNPQRFDQFYDRIRDRVAGFEPDLTTAAGRAAIAAEAFKVTKVKTTLERASKELTEEWRAKTKAVNDARKPMIERLDALSDQVRAPLTAWENAEKARREANAATLAELRAAATVTPEDTAATVEARGKDIHFRTFEAPQWREDEAAEAIGLKAAVVQALVAARNRLRQEEADREELARLRAAEAERQEREAAERAAREEAERQAQEAREREEAAERDRLAAEQREREAEERRERERQEAADKARREAEEAAAERDRQRQAEHERQLAAERAERERIEREAREAEEARQREAQEREAAAQRQRDQEAAEQRRRDQEAAEAAEAEQRRQRNRAHRTNVQREVKEAIMTCGVTEDQARAIVTAIVAGNVPHTAVTF